MPHTSKQHSLTRQIVSLNPMHALDSANREIKWEVTWQLVEARWRICPTLLWATLLLYFSNILKIHFKQHVEYAKRSNRHKWCTSWYCGEYLGFLQHSDWRSSAQVKGLAGLSLTTMSNRKKKDGRERLLLFQVLSYCTKTAISVYTNTKILFYFLILILLRIAKCQWASSWQTHALVT